MIKENKMTTKKTVKAIKIEVPEGMYREIEKAVSKKLYRNFADFFYVAGQKELDKIREVLSDG